MDIDTLLDLRQRIEAVLAGTASEADVQLVGQMERAFKTLHVPAETDSNRLDAALQAIHDTLRVGKPTQPLPESLLQHEQLQQIITHLTTLQQFILAISNGDLEQPLRLKGVITGSLKSLQASLRHLTWQTQQIATGDFTQRVDFMGEFSNAFNSMVVALDEAHRELKEKNNQLHELNANKDKFFSIISHDLRSPFTALLGFTGLLVKHFSSYNSEEAYDRIKKVHTSAERLYALLENLLTWSRLQRGRMDFAPENIDLRYLADNTIELFSAVAEQKQVRLAHLFTERIWAYADYAMVNTVFRNLVSNALKFTADGGTVTISARREEPMLEIAVSDSGIGMEQAAMEKLFRIDGHYTTPGTAGEVGTGLGLILCHDLVKKNGGRIWVESEVGTGTTFRFTLPCQPVNQATA